MKTTLPVNSSVLSIILVICFANSLQAQIGCATPAAGCSNTDLSNAYLNAINPNTIEYDNMVSLDHASMARQADGSVLVWGEDMAANGVGDILTPQQINTTNYPALTGSILKFAGGTPTAFNAAQFAVLTTDGLFVWGNLNGIVASAIKNTNTFGKITVNGKTDGLPAGVTPGDVKMLFAASRTMALTTCSGEVWVLSFVGIKNGDGTPQDATNNIIWHQVKTDAANYLTDIVAVRGSFQTLIALKNDGTLWTWGAVTYSGNNTAMTSQTYATLMNIPVGIRPKMIGTSSTLTDITYFLLSTDGNLFTLGYNGNKLLGDFSVIARRLVWGQVQNSATPGDYMTNIAWISPNEHSRTNPAINVLTASGDLYAWGQNAGNMLGGPVVDANMDPTLNPGGLTASDKILAAETGGHTTILLKQCSNQYGYVGHRVNGSMGNGTAADENFNTYNFTETGILNLCAVLADKAIFTTIPPALVCQGAIISLTASPAGGTFDLLTSNATLAGNQLTITGAGDISVSYTMASGCGSMPTTMILQQRDYGNLDPVTWPVASASVPASDNTWLGINTPNTDCGTNAADNADGLTITGVSGSGTEVDPWMLSGTGSIYTAQITVNGNGMSKPVYWSVWYDVNGNGSFTDNNDIFQTGNTIHGSPVSTTFNITIPYGSGEASGRIRVAATSENETFIKEMNGMVNLENGEIEDYYVGYNTILLPVQLSSFKARKNNDIAVLTWTTLSESNNKGFEVQRSQEGRSWKTTGYIDSKAIYGNSDGILNYVYNDITPESNTNYYRLKQLNVDGNFKFSNIEILNFKNNATNILISPNPTKGILKLSGLSLTQTIIVTNSQGHKLMSKRTEKETMLLDISRFVAGIYFITIREKESGESVFKIIKE